MNDRALPAIDPPATSTIRNVAVLLSGGSFAPASVQRSFEWEISYASQLLNDIDKVLARLHPEAETTIPADQDESEPRDNKADDNNAATSVAAPEDDFAF